MRGNQWRNNMSYRVLAVTFEIDAQTHVDGRFTVPLRICRMLGLREGRNIYLVVETPAGKMLYVGVKKLSSGTEIYGEDIRACVKAGQRIRVTASRPK
jgi:hypothetical protein